MILQTRTQHLELLQDYLASRAALFDPKRTNPQVIHVSSALYLTCL